MQASFKEAPHLQITEDWKNTWWHQPCAVLNKLRGIFLYNTLMQTSHTSKTDGGRH